MFSYNFRHLVDSEGGPVHVEINWQEFIWMNWPKCLKVQFDN